MSFANPDNWTPKGVDTLEPAAWTALRTTDDSICVVASAGAGKTEFLAQKAAYLLDTGLCPPPKRILAISFKRDAAKTLGERVSKRCDPDRARRLDSMTFDAFTKSIVDRFGPAIPPPHRPISDYTISFPSRGDWEEFLVRNGTRHYSWQTLSDHVANTPLPISHSGLDDRWKPVVAAYWADAFRDLNNTALTFTMLNRLAEYLIRTNDQVRRALQQTYPYVFLDEFQDTTSAQYELLTTAFHGSGAILTAVGDDKQRIMGWAGAMDDGFDRLERDFRTTEITLLSNWRSHVDLVTIQHVIAQQIDQNATAPVARAARHIAGDVAAIWEYPTQASECEGIADWIKREVADGIIQPNDVAILVRMRADQVEAELAPVFEGRGLKIRNVARFVGDITIQDLLAEELTLGLLPLLRFGAEQRAPDEWQSAIDMQRTLRGIDDDDEAADEALRQDLEAFVADMRAHMRATDPSGAASDGMADQALEFLGDTLLRQTVQSYKRDMDFNRVKTGFKLLLRECADGAETWSNVLDRFLGVGQTPLMTVHRSKGLEFHTMIFFGLDSRSWWSLAPDRDEELKSFFVAFTRAMQRAFFTSCTERGGSIGWIDTLLAPAGVARIDGPGG